MRIFVIVKCFLLLRGDAEYSEAEVCLPAQEETHPQPLSRGELP